MILFCDNNKLDLTRKHLIDATEEDSPKSRQEDGAKRKTDAGKEVPQGLGHQEERRCPRGNAEGGGEEQLAKHWALPIEGVDGDPEVEARGNRKESIGRC